MFLPWVSGSLETGVTDRYELPCVCWKLNSGPLEEESALLASEPSLQPSNSNSHFTFISSHYSITKASFHLVTLKWCSCRNKRASAASLLSFINFDSDELTPTNIPKPNIVSFLRVCVITHIMNL